MYRFDSFIMDICKSNKVLSEAILSGYYILFEGIGDMKYLVTAQSIFDKILNAISNITKNDDVYGDFIIHLSAENIVIVNTSLPKIVISSTVGNTHDPINNIITINMSDVYDQYKELLKVNKYTDIAKLLKSLGNVFSHEYRHFIDKNTEGNYRKFDKTYLKERSDRYKEIIARIKSFVNDEEELEFYKNMDYANNQTEKNARISQYMWNAVNKVITDKSTGSFDVFVNEVKQSTFYAYLVPESKKRVMKRLYYIWDALKRAIPDMKKLGIDSIDDLHDIMQNNTINENISMLMDKKAEYVYSLIENANYTSDIDIQFIIEHQVKQSWYIDWNASDNTD